jgi:hypothetical protein
MINKPEAAQKLEEETRQEASTILALLNNAEQCKQLRSERAFTLEKLSETHQLTLNDCKKIFAHSKVLYESGKYKGKAFL